uniref:Uncharacterized protein n=1 Tax=Anguilla anguilla TaxID=7936 RepID=A0A0E9TFC5_ANGAN
MPQNFYFVGIFERDRQRRMKTRDDSNR